MKIFIYHTVVSQEQQRVAVGPGNAQVTSDAATLRRCTSGPPLAAAASSAAAAVADAVAIRQFTE